MTTTIETPEQRKARYQVENMASLIGRLAYRLRKLSPNDPIAEQALDFLRREGLQGNPLRMDNGGSVMRSNVESNRRDGLFRHARLNVKLGFTEMTMDYKELLEHSYKIAAETFECAPESRLEYLGDHIFDFTTYDGEMSVLFARKAVEVCEAINNRVTFDYIKEAENYKGFLLMCNMNFFEDKLEWGTSISGAWWGARPRRQIEFDSCGLWMGDEQLTDTLKFSADDWGQFITAVIEFAQDEMKSNVELRGGPAVSSPERPA